MTLFILERIKYKCVRKNFKIQWGICFASLGVLFAYLGQIYTARNGHATICCAFDNLSFVYGYILVFLLLFPCFFGKYFVGRGGNVFQSAFSRLVHEVVVEI